ncbi:replication-relaxation family protein [Aceticella autotrophica]|uniref:Replication-relaxation family protein n=1 Tax=Aceticella autotrophica TaxID=2755338 RepID=A0A975GAY9_9THEO|nr:replication-relaxation family protein [Aceticella autotrophica]QSZ27612.1 replication-relaxation family protein [Aceticella autotrophica]
MQITDRDIEILLWINRMRFVTAKQVSKKFKIGIKSAYRVLKRLCDDRFLYHSRSYMFEPGVYLCTKRGKRISGSTLWVPERPSEYLDKALYKHTLAVVDLSIELEKLGGWISERELRKGHKFNEMVPDGVLVKDNKKVAIEVELTLKSNKRLDKKIEYYKGCIDYYEVWYFVESEAIFEAVKKRVYNLLFVKIYYLKEAKGTDFTFSLCLNQKSE